MRIIFFILFTLIFTPSNAQFFADDFAQTYPLNNSWRLRKANDTAWINNVAFPATIHQQLYLKNLIPDPYVGNNESSLKWIEETDWVAELNLNYFLNKDRPLKFLEIDQIQPYAKVYVNDKFIFESTNGFIKYQFNITALIDTGKQNMLKIVFESPVRRAKESATLNNITLPSDERIYTRQTQSEFGWDWGPRFVTTGIKGGINLLQKEENYIELLSKHISTKSYSSAVATVENEFTMFSNTQQTLYIDYSVSDGERKFKKIKLKKGENTFSLLLNVKNPQLWWPASMGDHRTYHFYYNFSNLKQRKSKSGFKKYRPTLFVSSRHAFCTIEHIQEKDSIGKSFYFNVNGIPTYVKGFNIIPAEHISKNNLTTNEAPEERLVDNLTWTGSNMVRVWGGGKYMSDLFYDKCMEYGIMVWQDFMFACAMYPGDTAFMKNVKEEITQQISRIRNFSNVAVWCGNNEIDEAWKNWGWQKQYNYSKNDSSSVWKDYQKIFNELIPSTLKRLSPNSNYISTSPQIGWGHKESLTQGDSHYWGVWWGKEPIETFKHKIPRFMSEFGMQAMPELSTLKKVIPDSVFNFTTPEFKNHQKHPTGFETINHYLKDELVIPTNMEDYAFATQILQSYTLKTAIEAQRRNKPRCMGTLIWQLNDTWPVTSWSVIDSDNQPKLSFNQVASSFYNLLISIVETENSYMIYIVNDDTTTYNDILTVSISDFYGKKLLENKIQVHIKPNSSNVHASIQKHELKGIDLSTVYLNASILYNGVANNYHFAKLNQLKLPELKYDLTVSDYHIPSTFNNKPKKNDYYAVEVKFKNYSPYFKSFTPKYFPNEPYDYTDYSMNFPNTILPGQTITVYIPMDFFKNKAEIDQLFKDSFKSWNDILNSSR